MLWGIGYDVWFPIESHSVLLLAARLKRRPLRRTEILLTHRTTHSAWFYRVAGPEFLFGLRSLPAPGGLWQEALREQCGLDLQEYRAYWVGEFVGDYQLVEPAHFLSGRSDAEQWLAPHPCPPLGNLLGLLGIRWRSSLPVKRRIEVAEQVCFGLRGPVINTRTGEVFDPVHIEHFSLENITSKWGFHDGDVFFDDPEYRAYVQQTLGRTARRSGVHVTAIATPHNPFRTYDAKEAHRTRGKSRAVDIWCFDRFQFNEATLGSFFATEDTAETLHDI